MANKIVRLKIVRPQPRREQRLKKSVLRRYGKLWAAATRETIKRLPCPPHFHDILRCFDSALAEIQGGRDICLVVGAAKPRP
jgi:hypothetical protein